MFRELWAQLLTVYETKDSEPNTFRETITLKDPIDGEILRQAVDETMKRYPYFQVCLEREGADPVFRSNPRKIPVLHTDERTVLGSAQTDGHLLCFCWWENRLHIDAYHGMTDGGGIGPLTKTLLYYYFTAFYKTKLSKEGIQLSTEEVRKAEWEDPLRIPLHPVKTWKIKRWNQPAFKLEDGGIARITPEGKVYNIRIPEKTFMQFNISNDGSPATIVAPFLAKMIEDLHPDARHPAVIGICVNQRKALRAPFAHHSLVGAIHIPYAGKIRKMPFSKAATCFRGMVALQSDSEAVLDEIRDQQALIRSVQKIDTFDGRRAYCMSAMKERSKCITATVSYVGKSNMGELEQYILENTVMPSTALPGAWVPLTVEMTAMNGFFFLNFIQFFHEEDYFNAFTRQLCENDIEYELLRVTEAAFPRIELPL